MATYLPAESAVARHLDPDWMWDHYSQLLALLIDETRGVQWSVEQGSGRFKKRKQPDRLPRPGVTPPEDKTTHGGKESALPMDEMAEWLGWVQDAKRVPARDARGRFVKAA